MLPDYMGKLPRYAISVFWMNRNDYVEPLFPRSLDVGFQSDLVKIFLNHQSNGDTVFKSCRWFWVNVEENEIGVFSIIKPGQWRLGFGGSLGSQRDERW